MIALIVYIAILGLITYLIITYVPMPPVFKTAITILAIVLLVLILLNAFGLLGAIRDVPVPRIDL